MVEPDQTWSLNEERKLKKLKIDPIKSNPQRLAMFVRHFKDKGTLYDAMMNGIGPEYDQVSKGLGRKIRDLTKNKQLDWVLERTESGNEMEETEPTGISVGKKP